jgi:hypothetical protein
MMNEKEVKQAIEVLDPRERVVVKLAVIAGLQSVKFLACAVEE